MVEQLKAVGNKITTALKKVSKRVWIILAVVVVLAAAAIAYYLNTRPYSILVTGASNEEIITVMDWLEGRGVQDYKLEGDTILVPERMASSLKASLLTETYSSTGSSGFSGYFDRVSALSTEKERGVAFNIALKEEIENVARSFPGVADATVSIAEGEDLNYILDHNNVELGTVSIFLQMVGNNRLTDSQATALRNFVANGVQGMSVDRVSISDSNGNIYDHLASNAPGEISAVTASELKLRMQEEYANRLNMQVRQVLENLYGAGNYSVAVNCGIDVDVQEIDEHQVILPEESWWSESGGAGIIGSRVGGYTFKATPEAVAGGVVGTTSNSDIPTYVEQGPDGEAIVGIIEGDYQVDYDNSTKDIRTYATACRLTDCTVAVTINSTTATANGQVVDVVGIRSLVAGAVGIAPVATETMSGEEYLASKIPVVVAPYYEEPNQGLLPPGGGDVTIQPWIIYAAIAGLAVFVVLLIVLLVLARKRKKKKQKELAALEQQKAMQQLLAAAAVTGENGEPMGADVMSLQSEKSMELRQSIRKFAEENPEIAAQMVKVWLRGGEESA